ncbi:C17orf105 [Branchiostoma lanceolatum]|uniref:C17orf105 protein n=1 Tax=Branchiostoma lanceolatum TaxID=7740 RepID=A0A8J9YZ38_BRALA|nr:C17orf105 [Branchiostoma lanceolatum]
MHRAYQPITPSGNKLLQQKWDDKYYNEHRDLVRTAKPMVDTKAPRTYVHMHMKLRKLQLEEERLATVERDNRILLEKMSHIMRTRGRVDNRNEYEHHSLNREKRQRELMRITKENQEILKRIMKREPEYDHAKWQRDWEKNEQFMDNIARYPKGWYDEWKSEEDKKRQKSRETSHQSTRRSSEQTPRKKSRTKSERKESTQSAAEDRKEDVDQSEDAKQTDQSEKPKQEEGAAGGEEEEPKKEVEEEAE